MCPLEILQSLLQQKVGGSLGYLENRCKEQVKTLSFTTKHFGTLNQTIEKLVKGFQTVVMQKEKMKETNKDKEKVKIRKSNTQKTLKKMPHDMIRSKTESNIHIKPKKAKEKEIHASIISEVFQKSYPTSLGFKKNIPLNHSLNSKTFCPALNNLSKSTPSLKTPVSNKHTKKKIVYRNDQSSTIKSLNKTQGKLTLLSQERMSNLSYNYTEQSHNKTMGNTDSTSIGKRIKPTEEFKEELISIQHQIQEVEVTLVNTQKVLLNRRQSLLCNMGDNSNTNKEEICYFNSYSEKKWLWNIVLFLPLKDKIALYSTSKRIFKRLLLKKINAIKNKVENVLEAPKGIITINERIEEIKKKYENDELSKSYDEFILSRGAQKAIGLLNDEMYTKIFLKNTLDISLRELIIIYRIYHQLINNEEISSIDDDLQFWLQSSKFLLSKGNNKLGTYVSESVKLFCFDQRNVLKLKLMTEGIKTIIVPSHYSKICGGTGLLVFIIKDALEYCGALYSEKRTFPNRIMNNLLYEKEVLEHLDSYCIYIGKM